MRCQGGNKCGSLALSCSRTPLHGMCPQARTDLRHRPLSRHSQTYQCATSPHRTTSAQVLRRVIPCIHPLLYHALLTTASRKRPLCGCMCRLIVLLKAMVLARARALDTACQCQDLRRPNLLHLSLQVPRACDAPPQDASRLQTRPAAAAGLHE